jgi:hypothetical protein
MYNDYNFCIAAPRDGDQTVEVSSINLSPLDVTIEGSSRYDIPQEQDSNSNIETNEAPFNVHFEVTA